MQNQSFERQPLSSTPIQERRALALGFDHIPSDEELAAAQMVQNRKKMESLVISYIDGVAVAKGFGDQGRTPMIATVSCASYIGDANQAWSAQATRFKAWRSEVWTYCDGVNAAVLAGVRTAPTEQDLLAELDANVPINWPSEALNA